MRSTRSKFHNLALYSPSSFFSYFPYFRYDASGFIVADVQVEGSIICFGDIWLSWSPSTMLEVTIESLRLLDLVKPLPELLVLGCGSSIRKVPNELMQALKERDISIEALDTVNAVAT